MTNARATLRRLRRAGLSIAPPKSYASNFRSSRHPSATMRPRAMRASFPRRAPHLLLLAAHVDHEDGHVGLDTAPDVPFDPEDAGSGSGREVDFPAIVVAFLHRDLVADWDRTDTAGAADQHPSPLPEAVTQTPEGASSVTVVYSASGLPSGLSLGNDRVIRGAPAAASASVEVTYTATGTVVNSDGTEGETHTASLTFRVTVNPSVTFSAETVRYYQSNMVIYDHKLKGWVGAGDDGKVALPAASAGTGTLIYRLTGQALPRRSRWQRRASPLIPPRGNWAESRLRWTSSTSPCGPWTRTAPRPRSMERC